MRTKVLCAAALAAGALTSMAQVYSANVVGYVNVTVKGGGEYNMLANPLDATMGGTVAGGNSISNLFTSVAGDGDQIFRWNPAAYDFASTVYTYSGFQKKWDTAFTANVGEGFWYINNNNDFTLTFVGQVVQGSYVNPVPVTGNGQYNALGAIAPIGGSFTNAITGIAANDGDQIFTWAADAYDFSPVTPTYSAFAHTWSHTEAVVAPGTGFIYINNGNDQTWTSNFTVQ